MKLLRSSSGFTLLELLVVITIIGILASVVVFVLNPVTQLAKARDTQRRNDLKMLQGVLEQYFNDHGSYPATTTWYSSDPNDYSTQVDTTHASDWIPGLVAGGYLDALPKDPTGGDALSTICPSPWKKAYHYTSNGTEYALISHCGVEATQMRIPKIPFMIQHALQIHGKFVLVQYIAPTKE